jgi:dTDP-glucose 4,6-dehydratase
VAGGTYNIGGDTEKTNLELVERLCVLVDSVFAQNPAMAERFPAAAPARSGRSQDLITFVADRLGHDRRYAIDATRAREDLGFIPETDFESGLLKTLHWYLENEHWWQAILDGSYRDWIEKQYGEDG